MAQPEGAPLHSPHTNTSRVPTCLPVSHCVAEPPDLVNLSKQPLSGWDGLRRFPHHQVVILSSSLVTSQPLTDGKGSGHHAPITKNWPHAPPTSPEDSCLAFQQLTSKPRPGAWGAASRVPACVLPTLMTSSASELKLHLLTNQQEPSLPSLRPRVCLCPPRTI